ncbi:MAG: serine hydrolase, partial [Candidatus Acidiferrales bacterium]
MRFVLAFLLFASPAFGQTTLQQQIRAIATDAHGKVSVACSLPSSRLKCDLDPHAHRPMQSVFKFPLAVATLHLVEQGKFTLDQPVRFLPGDRILPETYSPLQDKYPDAEVDVPLRELLQMAVSLSDNVAADIVLRTIGG